MSRTIIKSAENYKMQTYNLLDRITSVFYTNYEKRVREQYRIIQIYKFMLQTGAIEQRHTINLSNPFARARRTCQVR